MRTAARVGRIVKGLTRNRAETHPHSQDPRLRGSTYAITFDRVWTSAVQLADGGLRRWRVVGTDDAVGVIRAVAVSPLLRRVYDVHVVLSLDKDAQTRIDVLSRARWWAAPDWGGSARLIDCFVRELDATLRATPAQILDGSRGPHSRPESLPTDSSLHFHDLPR